MPRTNRPPAYRLHKARNCAVATIRGRNHYLGPYGSTESHEAYARLVAGMGAEQPLSADAQAPRSAQAGRSVNHLILAYITYAEGYYRLGDGELSDEIYGIKAALRSLRQLYG